MSASILALLASFLGWISQFGTVGQWVATGLSAITAVSGVVTAFVAIWQGVVAALLAASKLPFIGSSIASLAAALQADTASIDADVNQVLAFLDQLSVIPLPTLPASLSKK